MAITRHIQHIKSSVVENGAPKLPTASQILEGEIAVNYAKGYETFVIKNNNNEIVSFTNDAHWNSIIEQNEHVTSAALNDLNIKVDTVDIICGDF